MEKYHAPILPWPWPPGGKNPMLRSALRGLPSSMMVTVAVDWLGRFIDKKKDIPERHDSLDLFKDTVSQVNVYIAMENHDL